MRSCIFQNSDCCSSSEVLFKAANKIIMSNRARRIVAMAKNLNLNKLEEVNELHEQENDLNVTNLSDLPNKTSFLELNLEQILNPEDIADILNNAEVVFESTLETGIIMSDKNSSEQVVDSEIQDQLKRIISDPSFEIKNAEDSLDQYNVTKSSSNHMILEENKQSDPDYDATMECDDADPSEESMDEDHSEQASQWQVSEETSDLEGQSAREHGNRKRKGYNKRTRKYLK